MISKILSLLFAFLFSSVVLLAQTLMVDRAYQHLRNGELGKGLEAIELATQNEITSRDPKTWYIKAYLCKELYKNNPKEENSYRNQSLIAAKKCVELDANKQFANDCQAIIAFLETSYLNEAIESLNADKYENAITVLQSFVDNEGSAYYQEANYYSGYAALMLGKPEDSKQYFEKALVSGYQDPVLYDALANYYLEKSDLQKATDLVKEGKANFPEDKKIKGTELNILMAQHNYQEAELQAEEYLKLYPDNTEVMLLAGTVYDKLFHLKHKESDTYFKKRKEIYERVLQKEPDNLMANYNMGITLYNQAVRIINKQTETYDIDILEFNKMLGQCTDLFKASLPFMQKANELMPDNVNTLKAMQGIYYNLNDREKFNQTKAKLEALK